MNIKKTSSHHVSCIVCESTKINELKAYKENRLVKCQNCSLIFTEKIPTKEELLSYYDQDYSITSYFSPITKKRFETLLDQFEPYRNTNRILDTGCGHGFFLEVAKARGWEVHGTELSDKAIANCESKGIQMHKGTIKNNSYEDNFFDVIVSIEFIEHINHPREYAKQLKRIVRPNGQVYITTPNFNSLLRFKLKSEYDVISYPNHLIYFTKKTLKRLMESEGFMTRSIKTTGYSYTRQRTSTGKSNQSFVSETSDDEMLRYRIEKNIFLKFGKSIFNFLLNIFKVGDSLKGTFVKK